MKAGIIALVLVTLAGFVGYFIATAGPARPAIPPIKGKIAFTSDRDGNHEIYMMNADGTEPTNLTNHPASDHSPAWSADGAKIAFVSDRTGNDDIFVMNADGTGLTNLTLHEGLDRDPSWSPDGTQIAFVRRDSIRVLTIGLSPPANISGSPLPIPRQAEPAWSPDGSMIAFIALQLDPIGIAAVFELFVMSPDGSNVQGPLKNSQANNNIRGPDWSPDGIKIAFSEGTFGHPAITNHSWIATIDPDSGGYQQLTTTSARVLHGSPSWSPDGLRIAFHSFEPTLEGNSEIYVMDASDGSSQTNVTNHPANDSQPDWSPFLTVGGFSRDLDAHAAPQNAPLTPPSATSVVTFAAIVGSATLAAAWYARRRWRARM